MALPGHGMLAAPGTPPGAQRQRPGVPGTGLCPGCHGPRWSPRPRTVPGARREQPAPAGHRSHGQGPWGASLLASADSSGSTSPELKPLCETSASSAPSLSPHLLPHPTLLLGDGDIRTPRRADRGCSAPSKLASSSFPVFYYQLNLAWRGFSPHIPLAHKRLKNQQNHCLCLKGGDQGEKNSMF